MAAPSREYQDAFRRAEEHASWARRYREGMQRMGGKRTDANGNTHAELDGARAYHAALEQHYRQIYQMIGEVER